MSGHKREYFRRSFDMHWSDAPDPRKLAQFNSEWRAKKRLEREHDIAVQEKLQEFTDTELLYELVRRAHRRERGS